MFDHCDKDRAIDSRLRVANGYCPISEWHRDEGECEATPIDRHINEAIAHRQQQLSYHSVTINSKQLITLQHRLTVELLN